MERSGRRQASGMMMMAGGEGRAVSDEGEE